MISAYCVKLFIYPFLYIVDQSTFDTYAFADLEEFERDCLECQLEDYRHGTIIFNTFIFCQFFNEYTSKSLLDDWFVFGDLLSNPSFLLVSV
jgi:hypothetical protein